MANPNGSAGTKSLTVFELDVAGALADSTPAINGRVSILWTHLSGQGTTGYPEPISTITCSGTAPNAVLTITLINAGLQIYTAHNGPSVYTPGSTIWISGTGTLSGNTYSAGAYDSSHNDNALYVVQSILQGKEFSAVTKFTTSFPGSCPAHSYPASGTNGSTASCTQNQNACAWGPNDDINDPTNRHFYGFLAFDSNRNYLWGGFGSADFSDPNNGSGLMYGSGVGDAAITDLYRLDLTHSPGPLWTAMCYGSAGTFTGNNGIDMNGISVPSCSSNSNLYGIQETAADYDAQNDLIFMYGTINTKPNEGWIYCLSTTSPICKASMVNTWTQVTCSGAPGTVCPEGRDYPAVIEDKSVHKFFIFGGNTNNSQPLTTWFWDPNSSCGSTNIGCFELATTGTAAGTDLPADTREPPCGYSDSQQAIYCISNVANTSPELWRWKSNGNTGAWKEISNTAPFNFGDTDLVSHLGTVDNNANAFLVVFPVWGTPSTTNVWAYPLGSASSGTGGGTPTVVLSPTSLDFGGQVIGTMSAAQKATLTNGGTTSLTISSIGISGTNAADFAQTNNCPLSPSTLPAGSSCNLSITFTPSVATTESAAAIISDNASGSPQSITLSGAGTSSGSAGSTLPVIGSIGSALIDSNTQFRIEAGNLASALSSCTGCQFQTASDLISGQQLRVDLRAGTNTPTAATIVLVLGTLNGAVTSVGSNQFVLQTFQGSDAPASVLVLTPASVTVFQGFTGGGVQLGQPVVVRGLLFKSGPQGGPTVLADKVTLGP
jgi:hypothetical protein